MFPNQPAFSFYLAQAHSYADDVSCANSIRQADPVPPRHRSGQHAGYGSSDYLARPRDARTSYQSSSSSGYRDRERDRDRERYRDSRATARPRSDDERTVDAIFSAHSDGLMVILRPSGR